MGRDNNSLKLESERRTREIIELGGRAKKYEYEIQFMKNGSSGKGPSLRNPLSMSFQGSVIERRSVKETNRKILAWI